MGCGWDVGNPARGFFHPLPGTAGKSFPLHAHRDGITQGCWGAGPRSCPPALAAGKPSPGCSGEQCCVSPCPSLWAGLALSAHHSSPARHALSPQPPSFLLGCAVLPAQCHCPMSFPTEYGRGCSNGGVGEVCAGCLHTPGIRWDLSTHP